MREIEVEKAMRAYLSDCGFRVEERLGAHGVDIEASRDGKVYYIEAQGNENGDGLPFASNKKYTHMFRAIGQLCLRLNDNPDANLGLVLPEDKYYRTKVVEMKFGLQRLRITVYFVEPSGEVEELRRWE